MSFDFEKYIKELEDRAESNDIGKMIDSGIGVGIDKNSYLAVTALENVYVELETFTKNAAKNAENLAKKRQQRELDNLKNALKLELISEQEYYEKLKKYRDENLRQGTDAWYKYTEEIISYNKRLADEAEKEQIRLAEKIYSLQQELEENLKKTKTDWYSSQKIRLIGVNPDGSDQVYQQNNLSDFSEETNLLERYRDAILGLKALGNIPDGVFTEIGDMDVGDAVKAAETILKVDEETRKRFIDGYNKRSELSGSIAAQLNGILNKEELREAGIYSAEQFNQGYFLADDAEKTAFIKTLEESFASIPESYYTLGEESGDAFGKGFESRLSQAVAEARVMMLDRMNELVAELSAVAAEGGPGAVSNHNVYNTSYTFNASRDTTTAQLAAARNAATLEKMRGGIG